MRLRGVSEDGEDVLEYLPKLEQSFKNVGIQIRKDENTFKSTYEIMSDLASVWENLTDVQRANMSELVAGKRQGNIVMAMMSNYKDMQDSLTTALNSTNSALIENDKYMESIQAKQEQFANTVMGKWQGALDSNVIKGFVVAMTNLVEVFGNLEVVILMVVTAIGLWKGAALTASIQTSILSITALTRSIGGVAAAYIYAGKAQLLFNQALATNPIGLTLLAITTLITGFYALTTATKKHREEQQKSIEVSQNQIQSLKQQQSGLKELSDEYESLKNKENITIEEKKRLLEIQKELVDKYGVSATGINLEGQAYTDSVEAIKLRTLALEKELKAEQDLLDFKVKASDEQTNKEIKKAINLRDKAKKHKEEYQELIDSNKGNKSHNLRQLEDWQDIYNREQEKIYELSKNKQKYLEYYAQENIKTLESEGKEMSDSAKLVASEFVKSLALEPEDIETQQKLLEDFITKVANSNLDALIEQYNKLTIDINKGDDSKKNRDELAKTSKEITNLINTLTKANPNLKEFAINFASLYPSSVDIEKAKDSLTEYEKALSDFQAIYKDNASKIKELKGFLDEINDKGLTQSSIEKIISDYKEYIPLLENESELRKKLVKDTEDYQNAIYDAFAKTKQYDTDFYNDVKSSHVDLFSQLAKLYNTNIDNWANQNDAIRTMTETLISDLGADWSKYFEAFQAGSLLVDPTSGGAFKQLEYGGLAVDSEAYARLKGLADFQEAMREQAAKFKNLNVSGSSDSSSTSKADKYISDQYAISVAALDQELKALDYTKSKLSQTSEEYRNALQKEIDISKQKQQLAHSEADRLRVLRSQVAEGTKEYDDYTKSIQSLSDSWFNWQSSIDSKNIEIVTSKLEHFDKTISDVNDKLKNNKSEMQNLVPGTTAYNAKLQEQITLTKEYIQALQEKQRLLEVEIALETTNIARKNELIDILKQVKQALFDVQIDLTSQLAAQADEVISIYKSMYEKQKDIALDALDAQIEAEEKRHKNATDNLDAENDKYEDLIKAKLKLLEKEADQESYTKKLTKAQKESQEIQNKINILSLDDSFEARAKKEQLEKELAEKLESIEEMQSQHTLDARKDNLNNLLDTNKKEINSKKKTEDAKYKLEKDRLENIKKETARYWDNMINDERKWAQLKVDIMNGNLDSVKDSFASFTNILNGNLEFLGSSIVRNLIDKMKLAKQSIDSINSQKNSLPSDDTNDNSNHSKYWKYKDIINEIIYLKDVWVNGDEGQKIWAANEATKYYNKLPNDVASLLKSMDFEKIKAWASKNVYHSGGIVGDNSSSPSYLTQLVNKLFNTNSNEQLIKALKNELYVPEVNLTKFFVPNMSKLISGLTPQVSVAGGGDTIYNLNFHVDKIENNDKGVDYIFKKINSGLSKLGK